MITPLDLPAVEDEERSDLLFAYWHGVVGGMAGWQARDSADLAIFVPTRDEYLAALKGHGRGYLYQLRHKEG